MKAIEIKPEHFGKKQTSSEIRRERQLFAKFRMNLESLKRAKGPAVPSELSELRDSEIELLKSRIKKGDRVLDVGAGFGALTEAALDQGALKVWALETDMRAFNSLANTFSKSNVCSVYGNAQQIISLGDNEVDISLSMGNSLGMMWNVTRDWDSLVCRQKEAIQEMIRVSKREVCFSVQSKNSLFFALEFYLHQDMNVVSIQNGLVLIEEKDEGKKPYHIIRLNGSWDKFVFQYFDQEYLQNLLGAAGLGRNQYSIEGIPKGKELGYLVSISLQ